MSDQLHRGERKLRITVSAGDYIRAWYQRTMHTCSANITWQHIAAFVFRRQHGEFPKSWKIPLAGDSVCRRASIEPSMRRLSFRKRESRDDVHTPSFSARISHATDFSFRIFTDEKKKCLGGRYRKEPIDAIMSRSALLRLSLITNATTFSARRSANNHEEMPSRGRWNIHELALGPATARAQDPLQVRNKGC